MKRIVVTYGGQDYTVANTDLDELKHSLLETAASKKPYWLRVNHGEGSFRETDLLISAGIPIAISGTEEP